MGRALELLALATPDGEYRALVAESDGTVVGGAIYGAVAGSEGAGALYGVVVSPAYRAAGVGAALVRAAIDALGSLGARFAFIEMPDDPAVVRDLRALMHRLGFAEAARVPDFYRDGVALTLVQRRV